MSFTAVTSSINATGIGATATAIACTAGMKFKMTMNTKKMLAQRWNCSQRFLGMKVRMVYFVVCTTFEWGEARRVTPGIRIFLYHLSGGKVTLLEVKRRYPDDILPSPLRCVLCPLLCPLQKSCKALPFFSLVNTFEVASCWLSQLP